MLQLLWSSVMLVVLDGPPGTAHATAHTVEEFLEALIQLDDAGEAEVTSLVHPPPATSAGNAKDEEGGKPPTVEQKEQSDKVHEEDLTGAVQHVGDGGVEPTFLDQVMPQSGEVRRHLGHPLLIFLFLLGFLGASGDWAVGKCLEHLLRLGAAAVELAERFGGVAGAHVELDDATARVTEVLHVVQKAINQYLVRLLWQIVAHLRLN